MKCQLGKVKSKLGGVTRTADFAPAYALDRSQPESSFQFPERPQHLSPYIMPHEQLWRSRILTGGRRYGRKLLRRARQSAVPTRRQKVLCLEVRWLYATLIFDAEARLTSVRSQLLS